MSQDDTTTAFRVVTPKGQQQVDTKAQAEALWREHFADPKAGYIEVWEVATDGTNWCQELWRFSP